MCVSSKAFTERKKGGGAERGEERRGEEKNKADTASFVLFPCITDSSVGRNEKRREKKKEMGDSAPVRDVTY